MKKIDIRGNYITLVDDEDYEYLNQWKWGLDNGGYVARSTHLSTSENSRQNKRYFMHKVINQTPIGFQTDHINGNKLDNRRVNLRNATKSQNQANTRIYKNNKTGFKGVIFSRAKDKTKPYQAQIKYHKKNIFLGCFKTAEEAAYAYNNEAMKLHGEFARLNILGTSHAPTSPAS